LDLRLSNLKGAQNCPLRRRRSPPPTSRCASQLWSQRRRGGGGGGSGLDSCPLSHRLQGPRSNAL